MDSKYFSPNFKFLFSVAKNVACWWLHGLKNKCYVIFLYLSFYNQRLKYYLTHLFFFPGNRHHQIKGTSPRSHSCQWPRWISRSQNDEPQLKRGRICMHCHVSSSWQRRDLSCSVTCHPFSLIGWLSSREQWPAPSVSVHERSGQCLGACHPWRSLPTQWGPCRHGTHLLYSGKHRIDEDFVFFLFRPVATAVISKSFAL